MKGQEPVSGFLALTAILITLVTIVVLPPVMLETSTTNMIQYEYKNNNAQMTLLSLLYSTHTDNLDNKQKPVSEIIAEYLALPKPNKLNINFLNNNQNIVDNNKYNLTAASVGMIAKGQDIGRNYPIKMKIALPYNPDPKKLVDELILVID